MRRCDVFVLSAYIPSKASLVMSPKQVSENVRPQARRVPVGPPLDCIVLVKQVPDVSNIPEDAWDREKGTLRRAMLDSILNPLDLQALTFARRITESSPGSRTIYLSMGPPQARETLIDCLSRAPGEAILLTDRAFAGADTVATAYSLACAIRRIEKEIFGGGRDYVIVTGMQSVDGDTAQVPPQIAEELGIEHIAYAQAVEVGPELHIRRIGPQGAETIRPLRYPVLVTVTACMDPLYRSFHGAREARAGVVHEWSAESVGADPARTGLQGSRTQVYRIFSPSEERSKACEFVHEPAELMDLIKTRYGAARGGDGRAVTATYSLEGKEPTYSGEFWVLVEREGGGIRSVSLELLGKTRELAAGLGASVGAVLPCDHAGDLPGQLIAYGADKVYAIEHPLLRDFLPMPYKQAISRLVREHRPQVMLFGATPMGRELAPRVAYACDCGLTADCTKLEIGDYAKGTISLVGILKQTRPALGGNIMATILTKDSPTQMATVRPGVFRAPAPDPGRIGEVIRVTADLDEKELRVRSIAVESFVSRASIRDAEVIVAGGHGLRSKADFERYLQPLAEGLGRVLGATAKVGASRVAVEDGFSTHDRQVGQTGQTVQPRLYLALGISGAVQHISGMQGSEIIVAVNKDPKARIFNYADYGMVGDIETIVPGLLRALDAGQS
jgi:electron transfer flavoprotein alpha subunit